MLGNHNVISLPAQGERLTIQACAVCLYSMLCLTRCALQAELPVIVTVLQWIRQWCPVVTTSPQSRNTMLLSPGISESMFGIEEQMYYCCAVVLCRRITQHNQKLPTKRQASVDCQRPRSCQAAGGVPRSGLCLHNAACNTQLYACAAYPILDDLCTVKLQKKTPLEPQHAHYILYCVLQIQNDIVFLKFP